MTEVSKKVKEIIIDNLNVDEERVHRDTKLTEDLGADSLDLAELIIEFEKNWNITITDNDAEKIITVGDAMDYMEKTII
jgi:acyl carrier protein